MKGFLTDPEFPSSLRDEVAKRLLDPEKRQEIKENCLRCDERETCDSVAKW